MRADQYRRLASCLAVSAVAVATALAMAGPASADLTGNEDTRGTSGPDGIGATATIQLTRSGPGLSGRSGAAGGQVTVSVPVPCYYHRAGTGLEEAQGNTANRRGDNGRAAQIDIQYEPDSYAPREHLTDTDGHWYYPACGTFPDDWDLQRRLDYIQAFHADNDWTWVPDGTPPPQPPVSPDLLMQAASQALQRELTAAAPTFNPATRSLVNLETWVWLPPGAWAPSSVTATAGAVSVTVTATPTSLSFDGVPAGSQVTDACAGGGKPYDGSSTDCSIMFSRSSRGQPADAYHIASVVTWNVTATGAPLQGPPVLTRQSEPGALQVLESQAVITRWSQAAR